MKKLFLTIAACATMLSASASGPWDLGGVVYEADTLFHETTGPGITTTGVRLIHPNNKTNIFYSTIDLTNPNLELRGVQAQDHPDKTESVLSMGDRKNGESNGQYLAGVNGDFFNMGGKPIRTCGHSVVDGKLYNAANSGADWRDTWGSYATVTGAKDIFISTGVIASWVLRFPDGKFHSYYVNGDRWTNYLVIYTPAKGENTGTNSYGSECTMKLVSGSIETKDAVFEITSELSSAGSMAIPADGYVLSGHGTGNTIMSSLKVGDKLTMGSAVTHNDKEINPSQSVGGCPMIVMNGEVVNDEYIKNADAAIGHLTTNQARTVIGYNEDRTKLIILVADKYAKYEEEKNEKDEVIGTKVKDPEKLSYGTSTGMITKRMGYIMTHLGCYTAMNFDGGGSAQLYNKDLGIRNVPYGGIYMRPVANGFFAVSTTPEDDNIAAIEVRQKNVKLAEGETFTPIVYGYNKHGVLVNKNVTDFTVSVAQSLGSVSGTTFTAGAAKGATKAVVSLGEIKCGALIYVNGGGAYVTSGDDNAPVMVGQTYESDAPMGPDKQPVKLTEVWSFLNTEYNDGWDGTAPNWASEDAIKAKSCPRFATGRNGKFYTVDMKTMSIAEIDNTGKLTPLYKLPSLEGRVINDVPDYYGCAISSDDAGNFLIGHLFTKTDTYRVWTIYNPATGKAKHFEIDIPANEKSSGRIDNIGRVIGDLTKEAYAYVAPKATGNPDTNKALIIKFSGDGDVDNVTATPTLSKGLWMAGAGNTFSTIQPKYTTVEDMNGIDLNDSFYWYSKAAGIEKYTTCLYTRDNGVDSPNYSLKWNNHSGLNGFDTFTLGGKRYFAVAYSAAGDKTHNQHIVVMDEQSTKVAEWNNPRYDSGAGYNTITVVPIHENKVQLYVYNCTGDFYVEKEGEDEPVKTGAIAGALLTLTYGNGLPDNSDAEPDDLTPVGLNFDNYYDGEPFKVFSTETNGAESGPANFYKEKHPTAFEDHGQLTSILFSKQGTDLNSQNNVDANIQPMVTVRKVNEHIGNALIINEQYSPLASVKGWTGKGFGGHKPQFSFYIDNKDIKADVTKKHYVRVRLVYNALFRGCHHAQDVAANKEVNVVRSIYSTHEGNWIIPEDDNKVGEEYAETGLDFAKWVDETGLEEDIPAVPVVYEPLAGEKDPLDPTHDVVSDTHKVPYLMNMERFRVYEFDTYIDNPSLNTISVQFNILDRNISYIIKEIKFTDLGTDESAATLLGKRKIGWKYYNGKTSTSGIEDIEIDENGEIEDENAPAVYYNLQGVQIKNPANGIYIVRRGNKVTKEVIR